MRICTSCAKEREDDHFEGKNGTILKNCLRCRTHRLKSNQRIRENDPERMAGYRRRYHYGISPEEYESFWTTQEGKCAICVTILERDRSTHIDHCHTTKKIRGLLCSRCNQGLGLFQEDPERFRRAVSYLLK